MFPRPGYTTVDAPRCSVSLVSLRPLAGRSRYRDSLNRFVPSLALRSPSRVRVAVSSRGTGLGDAPLVAPLSLRPARAALRSALTRVARRSSRPRFIGLRGDSGLLPSMVLVCAALKTPS